MNVMKKPICFDWSLERFLKIDWMGKHLFEWDLQQWRILFGLLIIATSFCVVTNFLSWTHYNSIRIDVTQLPIYAYLVFAFFKVTPLEMRYVSSI